MDADQGLAVEPPARVSDADLVSQRRAQIVDAATRMTARRGFENVSVQDIAREAGMSVGLLYEYVRKKDDILVLVFEHWSQVGRMDMAAILDGTADPTARLHALLGYLINTGENAVVPIFYREVKNVPDRARETVAAVERQALLFLEATINEAIAAGQLRSGTHARTLAISLVTLGFMWGMKGHLVQQNGRSTSRYVEECLDLLVLGCVTPEGRKAWRRLGP